MKDHHEQESFPGNGEERVPRGRPVVLKISLDFLCCDPDAIRDLASEVGDAGGESAALSPKAAATPHPKPKRQFNRLVSCKKSGSSGPAIFNAPLPEGMLNREQLDSLLHPRSRGGHDGAIDSGNACFAPKDDSAEFELFVVIYL